MNLASRHVTRVVVRIAMVATVLTMCAAPATAQNKKHSWEVFLYFGSFYKNDIPSATQYGDIRTFRTEPDFARQNGDDPNILSNVVTPNLGKVGGEDPPDPNYAFYTDPGTQFGMAPCLGNGMHFDPNNTSDMRGPYLDECDNDQESRYIYNASHINTNGAIQKADSEFTLGLRAGYSFTRHWEAEFDLGFGKQRVDLTQNLNPLLTASINDLSDPRARQLAQFYQFTWANIDYLSLVYLPSQGQGEHPFVVASRHAANPTYNIPMYFPIRPDDPNFTTPQGETFADVTGFVNRIFQNPTAFRNRGNQINIDTFNISASINYNFNTKADSRIIPYLSAGYGKWMRNFDQPWNGGNTPYVAYGGGIRFFVNEIFSFRADARLVHYLDKSFTIKGSLHNFNLPDRVFSNFVGSCERDNRDIRPPCASGTVPASYAFPNLGGGGGNADLSIDAELADFYELRLGFDVVLGGK